KINLIGFKNSICGVNCPPGFPLLYLRLWVLRIATVSVLFWGTVPGMAVTAQGHDGPAEVPAVQHARARFISTLQDLAEQFSFFIDVLALQFSGVLGGWSRQPVLFGMTPAKILLLLLTFTAGCALAGLAAFVIFKCHSLGRVKPITE